MILRKCCFENMYTISYMMSSVYFSRATGDASSAISYFEESVDFLKKVPEDDLEVGSCQIHPAKFYYSETESFNTLQLLHFGFVQITHTLSVSLNKIGDLKYYEGDLQAARTYYFQALDVRRSAIKKQSTVPSQVSST